MGNIGLKSMLIIIKVIPKKLTSFFIWLKIVIMAPIVIVILKKE